MNFCACCSRRVDDNCLTCEGMCRRSFHPSCANWLPTDFNAYKSISSKVKWYCPACNEAIEENIAKYSSFCTYSQNESTSNAKTKMRLPMGIVKLFRRVRKKEEALPTESKSVLGSRPNTNTSSMIPRSHKSSLLRTSNQDSTTTLPDLRDVSLHLSEENQIGKVAMNAEKRRTTNLDQSKDQSASDLSQMINDQSSKHFPLPLLFERIAGMKNKLYNEERELFFIKPSRMRLEVAQKHCPGPSRQSNTKKGFGSKNFY